MTLACTARLVFLSLAYLRLRLSLPVPTLDLSYHSFYFFILYLVLSLTCHFFLLALSYFLMFLLPCSCLSCAYHFHSRLVLPFLVLFCLSLVLACIFFVITLSHSTSLYLLVMSCYWLDMSCLIIFLSCHFLACLVIVLSSRLSCSYLYFFSYLRCPTQPPFRTFLSLSLSSLSFPCSSLSIVSPCAFLSSCVPSS